MKLSGNLRAVGLWIILSWGWKRAVIAFGAGAVSALAMAPFNAWPVLLFTFPVVVWLIDGAGTTPDLLRSHISRRHCIAERSPRLDYQSDQ